MNNPTSGLRGTAKTSAPRTSPPAPSLAGPGEATVRTALGDDGHIALRRHRQAPTPPWEHALNSSATPHAKPTASTPHSAATPPARTTTPTTP